MSVLFIGGGQGLPNRVGIRGGRLGWWRDASEGPAAEKLPRDFGARRRDDDSCARVDGPYLFLAKTSSALKGIGWHSPDLIANPGPSRR
jgi:hypothetical protein